MMIDPTTNNNNNNENTLEETLLYQSKHIKSFSFNNEPERTTCQEFRITTRAIHLITMDHTGASSQINSTIPPIPFDKISMHAVNTPTDNDDDDDNVDDDGNASQQRQLLPYVYCHISDFVKLAQNTKNQHMTDDDDGEEEENDDDDDSFEELVITFAHPLSEEEIEQVFEAMNKGAELVPYVEESDMMNMMQSLSSSSDSTHVSHTNTNNDNDEWIYNREEVRKNIHLHERDDDSVSFLDAPKNDSAKIPRTLTTEE